MTGNQCLERKRVGVRVGVTILATFLIFSSLFFYETSNHLVPKQEWNTST